MPVQLPDVWSECAIPQPSVDGTGVDRKNRAYTTSNTAQSELRRTQPDPRERLACDRVGTFAAVWAGSAHQPRVALPQRLAPEHE